MSKFSKEVGVHLATEAARLISDRSDVVRMMTGISISSEAGWIIRADWLSACAEERRALENACLDAVRRPGTTDEIVERLEVISGIRDVTARWDDRMGSVALWRADGRPIDVAVIGLLSLASETARLHLLSGKHSGEMLRLLRRATCRTGIEVDAIAGSLDGVAAALATPWDSPDEIARVLLRARAEAVYSALPRRPRWLDRVAGIARALPRRPRG